MTTSRWRAKGEEPAIPHDLILLWGGEGRVITGSDLLGRLLRDVGERRATA